MLEFADLLLDLFGGLLTSGGSTATLMAVVAARHARVGEDASLLPRLTMYTSTQAHSHVEKDVRVAGMGSDRLRAIAVDESFAMRKALGAY